MFLVCRFPYLRGFKDVRRVRLYRPCRRRLGVEFRRLLRVEEILYDPSHSSIVMVRSYNAWRS